MALQNTSTRKIQPLPGINLNGIEISVSVSHKTIAYSKLKIN
jgi:hypothetical protein